MGFGGAGGAFGPPPAVANSAFGRSVVSAFELSAEEIKTILRRENELRLSEETQRQFKAAGAAGRGDGWLEVVEGLQRQVAAEFGLTEAVGLDAMRLAESLLPGDQEVIEISLYRKYNRCIDGPLQTGDPAPDADLLSLDQPGLPTTLHSLLHDRSGWFPDGCGPAAAAAAAGRPLAVLVGSYT